MFRVLARGGTYSLCINGRKRYGHIYLGITNIKVRRFTGTRRHGLSAPRPTHIPRPGVFRVFSTGYFKTDYFTPVVFYSE